VEGPEIAEAVEELFFGARDEILIREEGLHRNNDSSAASFGFQYCVAGTTARVLQQPRLRLLKKSVDLCGST